MAGYALRQMAIILAIAIALGLMRAVVLRAPRLLVRTSRKLAQTAMSIHRPKMKAPPALTSAFDGQGHRAPRE